uniref:Uncharacterized protein n=1 Tax=Malurus cyaneus samueli TaxID=2593467 RepID=A0A8C5UAW9_9PASS
VTPALYGHSAAGHAAADPGAQPVPAAGTAGRCRRAGDTLPGDAGNPQPAPVIQNLTGVKGTAGDKGRRARGHSHQSVLGEMMEWSHLGCIFRTGNRTEIQLLSGAP